MSSTHTKQAPAGVRRRVPTSRRLARRAAEGDQAAFEEIFRRHHQELYRYCLAILRNPDDAQDAVQATMAAAMRALPGEERDISLRPWLYRVAHNESITLLRERGRSAIRGETVEQTSLPPETELADRERLRELVADLQALPERQRSAIVMRELNDLSYLEIGGALSCSEPNARQAVYEARQGLQDLAEGRAMECEAVRKAISAGDRRRLRGRAIRSHMRSCDGCFAFEAAIAQRRSDLRALCPVLPAMAAAGMLSALAGTSGGGGVVGATAAGAGGGGAAAAGAGLAGSMAVKGASLVAAVAVAAGVADVSGLVDVPGPIDGDPGSEQTKSTPGTESEGSSASGLDGPISLPAGDAAAVGEGSSAAPGHGGTSPGKSEEAPGHGGSSPGKSDSAPGQTGSSPGKSEEAPGHGGTSLGKSDSAPGQTGSSPGKSEEAPGQGGSSPGNSESAPGQTGSSPGGKSESADSGEGSGLEAPTAPSPASPPAPAGPKPK